MKKTLLILPATLMCFSLSVAQQPSSHDGTTMSKCHSACTDGEVCEQTGVPMRGQPITEHEELYSCVPISDVRESLEEQPG